MSAAAPRRGAETGLPPHAGCKAGCGEVHGVGTDFRNGGAHGEAQVRIHGVRNRAKPRTPGVEGSQSDGGGKSPERPGVARDTAPAIGGLPFGPTIRIRNYRVRRWELLALPRERPASIRASTATEFPGLQYPNLFEITISTRLPDSVSLSLTNQSFGLRNFTGSKENPSSP